MVDGFIGEERWDGWVGRKGSVGALVLALLSVENAS
jgi:hypothetical protein